MTPEEKAVLVQQQVIAKIRWGHSRDEVAEWLLEKQGVFGEVADEMLTRAEEARRIALRERAYVRIACSFAGLALAGAFLYVAFVQRAVFYGLFPTIAMACVIAIGLTSLVVFLRNLAFLLKGDTPGSID
jgi:hypothetical protein